MKSSVGWTGGDPGTKSSYQNAIAQNPNTKSAQPTPKDIKSVAFQSLALRLWHSAQIPRMTLWS